MKNFLIVFLVFTLLFITVSCSNENKKPIPSYIIDGQSELMEIRNDNVPYFTQSDYEKASKGYFMKLSPLDELGRVVIPKEIRKRLKINNGDMVDIFVSNDKIYFLSTKEIWKN